MANGERAIIVSGCGVGGNGSARINRCFPNLSDQQCRERSEKGRNLGSDGAAKRNEERNKVQKQAAGAVENTMLKVLPVTAKKGLPDDGFAQVTVGTTGGTVTLSSYDGLGVVLT